MKLRRILVPMSLVLVGLLALMQFPLSAQATTWTKRGSVIPMTGVVQAWEIAGQGAACIIQDSEWTTVPGAQYRMWYTGMAAGPVESIGYAESPDAINWTRVTTGGAAVLTGALGGAWDDNGVGSCTVIKESSISYKMWYTGYNASNIPAIGYATSGDGITWVKNPAPVLVAAPATFYANGVMSPSVIKETTAPNYKMWFSGRSADSVLGSLEVGFATSNDGTTWAISPTRALQKTTAAWATRGIGVSCVVKSGAVYNMWYTGYSGYDDPGLETAIGFATASDGIGATFTNQNPTTPLLTKGTGFELHGVGSPWVIPYNSSYYMLYAGLDASYDPAISYAMGAEPAPPPPPTTTTTTTTTSTTSTTTATTTTGTTTTTTSATTTVTTTATGTAVVTDTINNTGTFQETLVVQSTSGGVNVQINSGTQITDASGNPQVVEQITVQVLSEEDLPPVPEVANTIFAPISVQLMSGGSAVSGSFSEPVRITLPISSMVLPAGFNVNDPASWTSLTVAYLPSGGTTWEVLGLIPEVDLVTGTISFSVSHFSSYTLVLPTTPVVLAVSQLTVTPAKVELGDAAVIGVTVSNPSEFPGSVDLVCKLDGAVLTTRTVAVEGNGSTIVRFSATPGQVGEFTVEVNGLSGKLTVAAAPTTPTTTPTTPATTSATTTATTTSTATVSPTTTATSSTTPAVTGGGTNWSVVGGGIAGGVIVIAVLVWFFAFRRRKTA